MRKYPLDLYEERLNTLTKVIWNANYDTEEIAIALDNAIDAFERLPRVIKPNSAKGLAGLIDLIETNNLDRSRLN